MSDRWLRPFALYLPAAVLLVAFVGVCVQAGTPWPWHSVVHEDGHRTLLETIFYFEHATRELLLDAVLAIAIAGAVRHFEPLAARWDAEVARTRRRFAIATLVSVALIVGGTAYTDGFRAIVDNLAQLHTREGAPLAWGAHWRYHFIERFAELALAFCIAGLFALGTVRAHAPPRAGGASMFILAVALFAAASAVFGVSAASFRDATYVGHQLRELLTHALVTLPLALGVCLLLARRYAPATVSASASLRVAPVVVAGLIAIACGIFLLVASVLLGARSHGQKAGLAELLFPHFFEHSLGYAFVTSCAGWLYLRGARRPRGG